MFKPISGDNDQTPHSVVSDLGLYCVPMAQRSALGLYGFRGFFFKLISFQSLNTSCFSVKTKQNRK